MSSILQACQNQLDQIEIIVVENGSSDQTMAQLKQFVQAHPKLIRLYQSASGVSRARNVGISKSRGKWLAFIDADDRIALEQMPQIFSLLRESTDDFLIFNFLKNRKQLLGAPSSYPLANELISRPTLYMTIWNKIFQKDFIVGNHILFNENLRLAEDGDFMLTLLSKSPTYRWFNIVYYRYRVHPLSTMGRLDAKCYDYLKSMTLVKRFEGMTSVFSPVALDKYILSHLTLILVRELFHVENPLSFYEKKRQLQDLVQNPIFKESLDRVTLGDYGSLYHLTPLFLKYRLYTLVGLLSSLRSWSKIKRIDRL